MSLSLIKNDMNIMCNVQFNNWTTISNKTVAYKHLCNDCFNNTSFKIPDPYKLTIK